MTVVAEQDGVIIGEELGAEAVALAFEEAAAILRAKDVIPHEKRVNALFSAVGVAMKTLVYADIRAGARTPEQAIAYAHKALGLVFKDLLDQLSLMQETN